MDTCTTDKLEYPTRSVYPTQLHRLVCMQSIFTACRVARLAGFVADFFKASSPPTDKMIGIIQKLSEAGMARGREVLRQPRSPLTDVVVAVPRSESSGPSVPLISVVPNSLRLRPGRQYKGLDHVRR